jgi:hypothetical protein
MKNLTDYSDQYILSLMEDANANPHKCTANVQYAVSSNKIVPVLCIYQDFSKDWDYDDRCIFCEQTALLDLCDWMGISLWIAHNMVDYYKEESFQNNVNDLEYEVECEEYEAALEAEHSWYIKARQNGWE